MPRPPESATSNIRRQPQQRTELVSNVTSGDVPAATEASLLGKAQLLRQTFARRSVKVKLPKFIAVVLVLTSVAIPVLAGAGVRDHRLEVTDGNVLVADPINQQLVEYNSLTEQVVSTINARQLGDAAFSVKQNGVAIPLSTMRPMVPCCPLIQLLEYWAQRCASPPQTFALV
jgi:hypothetical protein